MMHPLRSIHPSILAVPVFFALLVAGGCQGRPGAESGIPHRRVESTKTVSPLERGFDVESYAINLDIHPVQGQIEGSCAVRFTVEAELLEQLTFDLNGLEFYGALDERGERLAARQQGAKLVVDLRDALIEGDEGVVHLRYGGSPTQGLAFVGSRLSDEATAVYTMGGPESARAWFPCVDHPFERATCELTLEVPADWKILASGERVDSRNDGGRHVEVWRLAVPHAAHRFGLVAGHFSDISNRDGGVILQRLAPQGLEQEVASSLALTDGALSQLSKTFATDYPFPVLSQAVIEGMSDDVISFASLVLYDSSLVGDERFGRDGGRDLDLVRGLAEQWAGGLVEAATWSDAWVTVGMADYASLLWVESVNGAGSFDEILIARQAAAVGSAVALPLSGRLSGRSGIETADRLGNNFRERASTRMHLLRTIVGERAFLGSLQTFMNESSATPKTTRDLVNTFERVSGKDLTDFRADWVDHGGHPQFAFSWSPRRHEDAISIELSQGQPTSGVWPKVFNANIVVEVRDELGTSLHPLRINGRRQSFELGTNGGRPISVRLDVSNALPKTVKRKWDGPECLAHSRRMNDTVARHEAVVALAAVAIEAERARVRGSAIYVSELSDRMDRDSSEWVRAAAANSLGQVSAPEARERLLIAAATDPSGRVRTAALRALVPSRPDAELAEFGRRQFDVAFSWETMGAAAGLVATSDPETALPWLEQILRVPSSGDRLSVGVLNALVKLDSPRVRLLLADVMTDLERSPLLRARAAGLLAQERFDKDDNARQIAVLFESGLPRLRTAAVNALSTMGIGTARRALESYYPSATSSRDRRVIEATLKLRRPMPRSNSVR